MKIFEITNSDKTFLKLSKIHYDFRKHLILGNEAFTVVGNDPLDHAMLKKDFEEVLCEMWNQL